MVIPFIRTIILYSLVILAIRLMGKRQVGEMQPAELVITILVSAVASVPMQNLDVPLSYGIVPIFTLISAEIIMSFVVLKVPSLRFLLTGRPVLLIENGEINQRSMEAARISLDDLQEDLRLKDVFDFRTVRRAQLETNGQLSLLLFDQSLPITPALMELSPPRTPLFFTIISDGYVYKDNLELLKKDSRWLTSELEKRNVDLKKDVYLLLCDQESNTVMIRRES